MHREVEKLFWWYLTWAYDSTAGHIRQTLTMTYAKIKITHRALVNEKRAQAEFNRLITGALFKCIRDDVLVIPLCPRCVGEAMSWEHFFNCFGLSNLTFETLQEENTLIFLARVLANLKTGKMQ